MVLPVDLWTAEPDPQEELEATSPDLVSHIDQEALAQENIYARLLQHFQDKLSLNSNLGRKLVSSQDDKNQPFYRWFRYKEGFSSKLISYLLTEVHSQAGTLLDPFAGSGAALFSAASLGWNAKGIDVLPIGSHVFDARIAALEVDGHLFAEAVNAINQIDDFAQYTDPTYSLKHVAISQGAFPQATENALVGYLAYCHKHIANEHVRKLALFACFCVLEDISYTRKDGQYLRWDVRSGRSQGKKGKAFKKAKIYSFLEALREKLAQMVHDLGVGTLFKDELAIHHQHNLPQMIPGSCLEILPTLEAQSIDVVLTSPPYCNRYDYTRTYALELVFLGNTHKDITNLRQRMLSCTVENKTKRAEMEALYEKLERSADFQRIEEVFNAQVEFQRVLGILESLKEQLPNQNVIQLVRNYFYEMCFTVFEMARILTPGGRIIMVNDNVQYEGVEVAIDLLLANVAEAFGLTVEHIWMLEKGKGNSSQQMGVHGRNELRKGVYVWKKPTVL
jgi:DNA modification methylase